jgi:hypothetical protein
MKLLLVSTTAAKEVLTKMINSPHLPITTVWKLKKLVLKFNEQANLYEEMRNELVKKHATRDEDGKIIEDEKKTVHVDPANLNVFTEELAKLLQIEVEMPSISITDLGEKVEGLTASDFLALDDLIVD